MITIQGIDDFRHKFNRASKIQSSCFPKGMLSLWPK